MNYLSIIILLFGNADNTKWKLWMTNALYQQLTMNVDILNNKKLYLNAIIDLTKYERLLV